MLLAGCGTGGVSKSEFIRRADAICEATTRATLAIAQPQAASSARAAPGGGTIADYLGQVQQQFQAEASRLDALPRPRADRELLLRYLAALSEQVDSYRRLAYYARTGKKAAFARLEVAMSASPAPGLAASYGLHACSGAGSAGR